MPLYRRIRRNHQIRVNGPAVIKVVHGKAGVIIEADASVKIQHTTPKNTQHGLTIPKKLP